MNFRFMRVRLSPSAPDVPCTFGTVMVHSQIGQLAARRALDAEVQVRILVWELSPAAAKQSTTASVPIASFAAVVDDG